MNKNSYTPSFEKSSNHNASMIENSSFNQQALEKLKARYSLISDRRTILVGVQSGDSSTASGWRQRLGTRRKFPVAEL